MCSASSVRDDHAVWRVFDTDVGGWTWLWKTNRAETTPATQEVSARPGLQGTEYQSGHVAAQLQLEGGTWLHGESLGRTQGCSGLDRCVKSSQHALEVFAGLGHFLGKLGRALCLHLDGG